MEGMKATVEASSITNHIELSISKTDRQNYDLRMLIAFF